MEPYAEPERSPNLYFADGDVVLSAPIPDGGRRVFRVHTFLLSLNSKLLADMLVLPHPGNVKPDMYDGVRMIHVVESGCYWEKLLHILYHNVLPFEHLSPHTTILACPLLELTKKYQMASLHRRLVNHLEADWPITLAEWDQLETVADQFATQHRASPDGKVDGIYLQDRLPEPASAIQLARECNLPQILPAAYYHLSRMGRHHDWDKYHRYDEGVLNVPKVDPGMRTARWSMLQATDLHRLLQIRDKIMVIVVFVCSPTYQRLSPPSHAQCFQGRLAFQYHLLRQCLETRDPLKVFAQTQSSDFLARHEVCVACTTSFVNLILASRHKIWEGMCGLFLPAAD